MIFGIGSIMIELDVIILQPEISEGYLNSLRLNTLRPHSGQFEFVLVTISSNSLTVTGVTSLICPREHVLHILLLIERKCWLFQRQMPFQFFEFRLFLRHFLSSLNIGIKDELRNKEVRYA